MNTSFRGLLAAAVVALGCIFAATAAMADEHDQLVSRRLAGIVCGTQGQIDYILQKWGASLSESSEEKLDAVVKEVNELNEESVCDVGVVIATQQESIEQIIKSDCVLFVSNVRIVAVKISDDIWKYLSTPLYKYMAFAPPSRGI